MTTAEWIAVASIAAVVVSAFAIVAALKGVRDQLRVTVFLTYTDRYMRAMNGLPFEARHPSSEYRLASLSDEDRISVLSVFREYFNICSEECWLHRHHRIDHATWNVWERGMQQVAQFPCFREAWEILAPEYDYFDTFRNFVIEKILPYASASHSTGSANPHGADGPTTAQEPTAQA
jgi:hypothetical protein